MKTCLAIRHPDIPPLALVYASKRDLADADWRDFIEAISAEPHPTKLLVRSMGGAPDPVQREEVMALYKRIPLPRIGVFTDQLAVRGVITLLRWFWKNEIAAIPNGNDAAMQRHLGLSDEDYRTAVAGLERLGREVEGLPEEAPAT